MAKKRQEIAQKDRWNVELLYPSFKEWEADVKKWGREGEKVKWPEIAAFKGKIGEGPHVLKELLDTLLNIERHLEKLYTYAHLCHDVDMTEETAKKANGRIMAIHFGFYQETAWFAPELLKIEDDKIKAYLESDQLKEYTIHLEKIVRLKPHTLSEEEERLYAYTCHSLMVPSKAFQSFNNADLKFADVEDSQGKKRELTHGTYSLYLKDTDRTLRENSFKTLHQSFLHWENTLCELLQGQVHNLYFLMQARTYPSCLEAALFTHQIDTAVYTSLIETVRQRLPKHHAYMALRKKLLGVDELHLYDMYVPVVPEVDYKISYEEAQQLVIDSVALLGPEYQKDLSEGLKNKRWVDRYENEGKRAGAYSGGCYDSPPYILLNFMGSFRDLTTLSHEAGHSMQTLLSNRNQPYQYASYPIFTAEVASTFHEEILIDHLLKTTQDPKMRAYIINQRIDELRATFFRQAMFAEFELQLHRWVEKGTPLTPALLKDYYLELNKAYFGPHVIIDDLIKIEWARIPHFYSNFYVYQYATGISASLKLVDLVKREGESARKRYIEFISSGGARFPLDLLKRAGVDMTKPEATDALITRFSTLVKQLDEEMGKIS